MIVRFLILKLQSTSIKMEDIALSVMFLQLNLTTTENDF